MNERTDERIDELIALAALGEISESEEAELDALLSDDADVRGELDEALDTAALLHASVAEAPPVGLRASVLDAIAETPQSSGTNTWVDQPPQTEAEPAPVIDLAERRRTKWIPMLGAAAAVVLLAGVGLVFVRGDSLTVEERAAIEAEDVVTAGDAVSRTLEGTLDGTLTVVYSPGEDALVIDGDGLPVLGEDRAFVLWFVGDDGATPVQTFQPDASGNVLVRVDDVDPTDFVLGITEEDAAGAETPTLPIIATA